MSVTAMRWTAGSGALVWLAFTGAGVVAADPSQGPPSDTAPAAPVKQVEHTNWIDDPYAPHVTEGMLLRFGTAVGGWTVDQRKYTALGGVIALGRRAGIFSIEAEYDYVGLHDRYVSSIVYGRAQDLALVGRIDVLRLGPEVVGENSMIAFYAEGAVEETLYHYYSPGAMDAARAVPDDNMRTQAAVGFGALLDHRLEEPLGFPNRFGWRLGWRLTSSPRDQHDGLATCRGCLLTATAPMTSRIYDTELIVTSTLDFTW